MMFIGHLYRMQNGTWSLRDGLSAGSIDKGDLVRAFREIGFCEDGELQTFYESMLTYVEENADLLGSGEVDPTTPCDAMSFAIGFQAAQLTPGTGVAVPPPIECCLPGKTAEQCLAKCGDGAVNADEKCDTAIPEGQPGACPTRCAPTDACTPQIVTGSACAAECQPMPITMIGAKDGCCPRGGNGTTDVDCKAVCGNGVVESGETCDPPGSCASCTPSNPCTPRVAMGSAENCNLRCDAQPITTCDDGDRCCPNGCSSEDDDDCSASCGNERIEEGETCENGTDRPCDTDCNDGNACTTDASMGSAANCNVACTHEPITQPVGGDGCCPEGATANSDADCQASCGNQTVEGEEQCDDGNTTAGDGCFECKAETQEQICIATLAVNDACTQCTCNRCSGQALGCYGNENATEVQLCDAMVDCARRTDCGNPDCFCGSNALFTCLLVGGNGPCQREVIGAAKTDSLVDIDARSDNLNFPLGRANALGDCVAANCATECGR